jgi:hypothetical protein
MARVTLAGFECFDYLYRTHLPDSGAKSAPRRSGELARLSVIRKGRQSAWRDESMNGRQPVARRRRRRDGLHG